MTHTHEIIPTTNSLWSSSSSSSSPISSSYPRFQRTQVNGLMHDQMSSNNDYHNNKHGDNNNNNNHSNSHNNDNNQILTECIAGGLAGMFAKTAVAPIERIKLLLQLRGEKGTALDVSRKVLRTQGFLSLWRGNFPNVLRQGGTSGLNFMLMDRYKATFHFLNRNKLERRDIDYHRSKLVASFVSGGLAGGTATSLLYPFEFMRTRLAMDSGVDTRKKSNNDYNNNKNTSTTRRRKYPRGMRDVFAQIIRGPKGILGLYEGYAVALSGVIIYRALHLGGYDALKYQLFMFKKDSSPSLQQQEYRIEGTIINDRPVTELSFWERFAVAQVVSLVAGTLCYPIDSIRRRLMMQAGKQISERTYYNGMDCFRKILRDEGPKGFYLGIGPNVIRSVGGALLLVAYDEFKGLLI